MFRYNLWLAAVSLKRNPGLTALMIAAIALGIGMSMTSFTVLSTMSGNPLAHKNNLVRRVQLDNWDPERPFREPNEPPELMSYRDVSNLLEKGEAQYKAASFPNVLPL
ncbi:MAG: ABC transporter permease, partial [Lysobacterales bacterium]